MRDTIVYYRTIKDESVARVYDFDIIFFPSFHTEYINIRRAITRKLFVQRWKGSFKW